MEEDEPLENSNSDDDSDEELPALAVEQPSPELEDPEIMSSTDTNQLSFDEEHGRNQESQLNRELPSDSYQIRGNLASIVNPILAQDDTGDDFNYIQNIGNWDTVEEMNVQRREERENIDKEVALRAAHITSEQ